MSYHLLSRSRFGALGAATPEQAGICAEACQSSFANRVRRGKCTAACAGANDLNGCMGTCDSSFDTRGRKEKCRQVCSDVWISGGGSGGGSGGLLLGTPFPIIPIAVGVAGLVGAYLLLRKKS